MKYTLACSYKNSVWFWLNTDCWAGRDARYWFFFPLCTLAVLLASHFGGRSLQHCPTGSLIQCIPTLLTMVFALTRWQHNVASPVPKRWKKKPPSSLLQMLVRNRNCFQYLHVHTSKIQATSRFYFTPQKTQSPYEIRVPKCETERQRRQAGNEGLAHQRLWTEPTEFSRSTLQLKIGTKGGKASKDENVTRRQRAELVQSEGFGRQRPHITEMRRLLWAARRLLWNPQPSFSQQGKKLIAEGPSWILLWAQWGVSLEMWSVWCAH